MAKKEEWGTLKELIIPAIKKTIESGAKSAVTKGQDIVYHTAKKLIERLMIGLFFLAGMLITLIAVGFLLMDYLGWSAGQGFLVIGIIFLLMSYVMRQQFNTKKYSY